MKETRIYIVVDVKDHQGTRLVRADNPHRALRYVVVDRFHSRLAAQEDIVRLMGQGKQVEDTGFVAEPDFDFEPPLPAERELSSLP